MKKIYSLFMALSIVLCAMANSFEAAKSLEISMAKSQVTTPVINKTVQVSKHSLQAKQQERMAIAKQAQSAPAVKVNGVRGAEVTTMPTAAKQVMPVATNNKQMAAAQVTEATDTVEIVGYEWDYEYYSDTKDWYMTVIDASQTYVVRLDYLVAEEDFAGTYNIDNLDLSFSYLTIYDEDRNKTYVDYVEADFTVSVTEEGKFLTANLLCKNGIRYLVTAEEFPLPEPIGNVDLAYTNATLVDGTRSSETFQFWANENGVYTSFLIASDEVAGEYTQEDMYVAYANYIMFVDGTDTTFVDFLGFELEITKEGKTYNLVADALGTDTILYHITMSYTKPDPTDTIDIVATNLYIDEFEFWGMTFCSVEASNAEYQVAFELSQPLTAGEYTTSDFDASYCGILRLSDETEIAMTEITATVTGEGKGRAIKAAVVGDDNILYNMDLSYVIPEATDTVNVVFDELAVAEYYASSGDYYIYNANENYIVTLDIFAEKGELVGEFAGEDFDLYYTQLGVITNGDTAVVTIADAKAVVSAAEEGIALIEAELLGMDAVLYKVSTKVDVSEKGLEYDATEGFLVDSYTTDDIYTIKNQAENGYIMFDVEAADGSDLMGLVFWVDGADENTIIPTGTYEINDSGEPGTVLASTGMGATGLTYSLYATMDEEGYIVPPCWFMTGGEVVVTEEDGILKIEVDAVNSNNLVIYVTCEYELNAQQQPQQGLQHDATEGAVDRSYATQEITITKGTGYFQVLAYAADGTDMTGMLFIAQEDENTIIPVGTYEINATEADGTVLASSGVSGNSITLSFYGETNAQGNILVPCWFMVEGTVVVTATDGKLNIEVNAVNSNNVPIHIVMEYNLNAKQGLQYDMTEGSLNVTYTDNDDVVVETKYLAEDGVIYLDMTAADGSHTTSVAFFVEAADPTITIPAGTYPINDTQDYGTVMSSPGVQDGYIYPSFYGNLTANGGISIPCYFMVGGNVVVENVDDHLKVTINALNSYDVPATIVYEASATAVENIVSGNTNNASKMIENGQLMIIKNDVKYNVLGSVVK